MLKRNWNWRNYRIFCYSFVIGEISIGKGGGPPAILLLATSMLQVRKTKKVLANFPRGFWRFPTKFQLFKKECCPRAEDRPIFEDLRLRGQGQGQGLDLRGQGQGQGLQNVSSRTSSRPRTSSRTPPLILKAKNKAHSSIQHFGKSTQHTVWQSIKQSITIVQMTQNHRMNKLNFKLYR